MDAKADRKLKLPPTGAVPKRKPIKKEQAQVSWAILPYTFIALTALSATLYTWPLRWIISGAPLFLYCILLGDSHGHRILPYVPIWTIFSSLNLVYAICTTSWLLYWGFVILCYPCVILCCLFQFEYAAGRARHALRRLLRDLHFTNDNVAFFDLPAMEFDTETKGLLVIRGATLCLSTLTLVAHGVEVAIKLSDDMELAIQVDKVTVSLFRSIEIDDVYANVKGGDWEMTFGTLSPAPRVWDNDELVVTDTPIMRAASLAVNGALASNTPKATTAEAGAPEERSATRDIFEFVTQLSPDDNVASQQYEDFLRHIHETSSITTITKALRKPINEEDANSLDLDNINDVRAAIAGQMQDLPSIPHPPKKTIRLSTIRHNSYPRVKKFLHRLPLLYRLLLNPISYMHPVHVKSVTAAGSGKWFKLLMDQYFFKHYTQDQDVRRLEGRIGTWLADANFAVELGDILANAQVPVNTTFDIESRFKVRDVMAYRILPGGVDITQVVRIGGADLALTLPTYLFPHHEHIFPAKPTADDERDMEEQLDTMGDSPQSVQARTALEQLRRDEANMKISAHAHLPARFHQDLLNFIAALVKALKVIESDKAFEEIQSLRELRRSSTSTPSSDSESISSASNTTIDANLADNGNGEKKMKAFLRKVDTGFKEAGLSMRDGMRKAGLNTASAVANDRWIAKLVGKLVRKLEKAQGEIGYSANVPLSLEEYRLKHESEKKILP